MTTQPTPDRVVARIALFGALASAFHGAHLWADHWLQRPKDAVLKGLHGDELVYPSDGTLVCEVEGPREGEVPVPACVVGRRATTSHVLTYAAGQLVVTEAVARTLGMRSPWRARLVGAAINFGTHWIIDRRRFLLWLAQRVNHKDTFISYATVMRKPDTPPDTSGPGTALYDLDQGLHKALGIVAAAVTARLAVPGPRRRRRGDPCESPAPPLQQPRPGGTTDIFGEGVEWRRG
ncbi:hypothetical protein SAMN05216266_14714 [Amycolatopsis marina]|uniref:Uncharacterized protein n=1 Tax=Amycolatopsis marina TaxID=490629 RepID=A0A1I1CW12_9PSEU|nr:hypothetical protein [Amycolatopsis marina]SFB64770.1 hypothetical protein SAMN05216266_14714 [Amycolatopsis marina]